ncbi:MAG TPA: acyl-CoA thioesterase [Caldilineae bacterium]|nr:acyl-CoA thioesterase [Caldilineae bacterium]
MTDLLADYPIIYETDVVWGDMDAFQHVNNVVYFRYFESARVHYFEHTRLLEVMKTSGIGPIVHSQNCRYRFPLSYPDRIQVGVRIPGLGEDRFPMQYKLVSARKQVVAAEGETLVVMFDYGRNQKTQLPASIRAAIAQVEGWALDGIPVWPAP